MNIIERPLPDGPVYGSGPNKGQPIPNNPWRIVVHSMAEYILDPDPIFAPNFLAQLKYSAHALIVPNGDVMICRNTDQTARHARGFNIDSLGVEFLVHGGHNYETFLKTIKTDWVTPNQYAAGIELVKSWRDDFDIKRKNIDRHSDKSPGRKVDPGAGFKWEYFLNSVTG